MLENGVKIISKQQISIHENTERLLMAWLTVKQFARDTVMWVTVGELIHFNGTVSMYERFWLGQLLFDLFMEEHCRLVTRHARSSNSYSQTFEAIRLTTAMPLAELTITCISSK